MIGLSWPWSNAAAAVGLAVITTRIKVARVTGIEPLEQVIVQFKVELEHVRELKVVRQSSCMLETLQ